MIYHLLSVLALADKAGYSQKSVVIFEAGK